MADIQFDVVQSVEGIVAVQEVDLCIFYVVGIRTAAFVDSAPETLAADVLVVVVETLNDIVGCLHVHDCPSVRKVFDSISFVAVSLTIAFVAVDRNALVH